MSGEYFGSYPDGRQVFPEQSEWPFGQDHYSALPEFVEWCRQQGWEELTEDELDFSSYRKKVIDRRDGSRFRYYNARIEEATAAGVSAFCVRSGQLILLNRPNAERIETELIGKMDLNGRQAKPHEAPAGYHKVDRL